MALERKRVEDFNNQKLKALKAGESRVEWKDEHHPLYIVVEPSGTKRFVYRGKREGRSFRHTLGVFDDISLATARSMAHAFKQNKPTPTPKSKPTPKLELVPTPALPLTITPASGKTVSECFGLYMKHEGDAKKSSVEKWRIFRVDVEPHIGSRPIAEVTEDELADILATKFETSPIMSNRVQSLLSRFFRWSRREGKKLTGLTVNPMAEVSKMASESGRERTRTMNEREIVYFLKALPAMNKEADFGTPLEVTLRTALRRSNVFDAQWSWIEGDKLIVPSGDMKKPRPHIVWLHPTVRKLIGKIPEGAKPSDPIFSVSKSGLSNPVTRLREKLAELAEADGHTFEHLNIHDLRRTVTTMLAGMLDKNDQPLVPEHILGKILAHKDTTVRGRHYNMYEYYAEKKAAMKLWNDYLDRLMVKNKITR